MTILDHFRKTDQVSVDEGRGVDIALLVVRLALATIVCAHGLQKLVGAFGGSGLDGFAKVLDQYGFSHSTLMATVTGLSEFGGGTLIALGLCAPAGAAAVFGVTLNILAVKVGTGFFMGDNGSGYEFQMLMGSVAFALLFSGPGCFALDRPFPWGRRPLPYGLVGLVISVVLSGAVIVLLKH